MSTHKTLLLTHIPLHAAQDAANRVHALEAPLAEKNDSLSFGNIVIVVLGGALCALALLSPVRCFAERLNAT